MKKLNKKGFTLIELMVVIAILVIIMVIALPNITSSIERSKQKQIDNKRQLIVSAGELYFDRHKTANKENGVTLGKLIADGYLTREEIENVCDYSLGAGDCCVKFDNNSESKTYKSYIFDDNTQWCGDNAIKE